MKGARKARRVDDEPGRETAAAVGGQSIIESAAVPRLPASAAFWGELHTFLAVAEHRSVTRAAEILGLGRATVTRQIRRLQDVLGHQLLVLTKHGALLTQKGEELFRELARIDRDVVAATASLRAKGANPEGDVRIGISDGLGLVFLLPRIEAFSRDYPHVHLHLTRPLPFEALRENKMDVVVGFRPERGPDIVCEELGSVHFVPFAGRKYVAKHGVPRADTVEKHRFITTRRFAGTATWNAWHAVIARAQTAHSCDTSVTYGLMVKAGLGVGLLPSYVGCEPSFVPVDLGVCIDIPLYAVALRERLRSRSVRVAFDLVASALRDSPWLARELTLDVATNGVPTGYDLLFNITEAGLAPV